LDILKNSVAKRSESVAIDGVVFLQDGHMLYVIFYDLTYIAVLRFGFSESRNYLYNSNSKVSVRYKRGAWQQNAPHTPSSQISRNGCTGRLGLYNVPTIRFNVILNLTAASWCVPGDGSTDRDANERNTYITGRGEQCRLCRLKTFWATTVSKYIIWGVRRRRDG